MAFVKHLFRKKPKVSLASKIGGILLLVIAVILQVYFVLLFIQNTAAGFPTRAEVVARVVNNTGLPTELVNLYADSVLVEYTTLVFVPIGVQVEVPFEPVESVLAWGGRNPVLKLQIDAVEYTFSTVGVVAELVGTDGEASEPHPPPIEVELYVPPDNWDESLNTTNKDLDPYLVLTVTDASTTILHSPIEVYASFDLIYAQRSDAYHFTNFRRDAKNNYKEFKIVIVSQSEGALLEASKADLVLTKRTLGNLLELIAFLELIMLVILLFAFWVYRGGLE